MHYIYLLLIFFTISYPLFKSFEDKIQFHTKWKFLFPGILLSALFFISWDIYFTHIGVWSFNPDYVSGLYIANLPIEEWLFFIIVPYSCVFIYEVMNYFVKKDILEGLTKYITYLLILFLFTLAFLFYDRIYTLFTCSFLGTFLLIHQFFFHSNYLGRFYIAWAVCFFPFFIVNGVLTYLPVVLYNNLETIGFRIFTIPFEDFFYGMLNVLIVVTVYEYLKQKK